MTHFYPPAIRPVFLLIVVPLFGLISGCQSPKIAPAAITPVASATTANQPAAQTPCTQTLPDFHRTGKLGVTVLKDGKREALSTFYDWSQNADTTFSLALWGALGASAQLSYDGQSATLTIGDTRQSDTDPQLLLSKVLGIDAPIDSLALWVLGKCTPNQMHTLDGQNRLSHASQGSWSAQLFYDNDPEPSRLVLTHKDGHRLVMTAKP